eukprot:488364_1
MSFLVLVSFLLIRQTFQSCDILFDVTITGPLLTQSVVMLSLWGTEYLSSNPHCRQSAQWVPNDDRRHDDNGLDFFVHIDDTQIPSSLNQTEVITAIKNAVHTWDTIPCSKNKFDLIISDEYKGKDVGYAEYLMSGGQSGLNRTVRDIVFGGFVPSNLFGDGSETVGAATVLFDFEDQIMYENQGEISSAEIYFNNNFSWGILEESVNGIFDIETVALHELGHALSQSHFHPPGKIISSANGMKPNDANDVVMAPLYFGVNHDLAGVDIGGHCSEWANWGSGSGQSSSKQIAGVDLDESHWKTDYVPSVASSHWLNVVIQPPLMMIVMVCLVLTPCMMAMACLFVSDFYQFRCCPMSIQKTSEHAGPVFI